MLLSVLIIFPVLGVILLNLLPKLFRQRCAFWLAVAFSLAQLDLVSFFVAHPQLRNVNPFHYLFNFDFNVDVLSLVMIFAIGLVVFISSLVGRHFVRDREEQFNFFNLIILITTGMNALVLTSDVFSLYVFIEVVSAASFILISFHRKKSALDATFRYIILSVIATALMLTSIALLLIVAGDTRFSVLHSLLKVSSHNFLITLALGIFLCGLFIKSGLVPFHGWLPESYTYAPPAVSVLLAGIVTKVGGVYTLMRIVYSVFGFTQAVGSVLMLIGTLSIVIAALTALTQNDFKKMLSYSSISQVGYIIVGFACGTILGFIAAMLHLLNHTIFKSLLFVNAASVEEQIGNRNIEKMGGLSDKMPITSWASSVGCLSTAGIPPLAGFWSKLLIIIALWMSGHVVYAVIAALISVVTLAYMLILQGKVFFGTLTTGLEHIKEADFTLALPTVILTVLSVGIGIFFPYLFRLFGLVTRSFAGG